MEFGGCIFWMVLGVLFAFWEKDLFSLLWCLYNQFPVPIKIGQSMIYGIIVGVTELSYVLSYQLFDLEQYQKEVHI